ncbi:MAG: glycosyltransferase family 2 protein [Clostridia bacterium]|nr:glycosyltransferase family 2 protein [Clostridia bacterium]
MPKISVIIPAYNNEKYIAETLKSLQAQTFEDFEIVIVNDGSTDKTEEIIRSFDDERIRLFNQENAGVSAARNKALEEAKGDYVCFLDADDLYEKNSLEGFINCALENDADLVLGRIKRFDEHSEYINEYAEKFAEKKIIDNFDKGLLWNLLISNKFYKREKLVEYNIKFPPIRYAEETPFFLEFIYHRDVKICGTKNATMCYRKHSGAVSQSVRPQLVKDYITSLNSVRESAEKAGADEDYIQEIIYKKAQILISQFYRFFWRADEESLCEIKKGLDEAISDLSDTTYKKLSALNFDLDLKNLIFSHKEMAEKPKVSIVLKNVNSEIIDSVYTQLYPCFELIVPKKSYDLIPDRWKDCKNLVISEKANLKSLAKADVICVKGEYINIHLLRQFVRFRKKFNLPSGILYQLLKIYLKIKV